jgi:hypothetical protein
LEVAAQAANLERDVLRFDGTQLDAAVQDRSRELGSALPIAHPERLDRVEEFLRLHTAGVVGTAETRDVRAIMSALRPGEMLIEYCLLAAEAFRTRKVCALVITRETTAMVDLVTLPRGDMQAFVDGCAPLAYSWLHDSVAVLRRAVEQDHPSARVHLAAMYEVLIQPLQAAGFTPALFQNWIIIPDGLLHSIPFTALLSPSGRFLGEEVAVRMAPSASVWFELQRASPPLRSFLGIASPHGPGLAPLPYAVREVVQVGKMLRNRGMACEILTGANASETRLKTSVDGKSVLHIASHGGFASAEAFDFHELRLAPSPDDDGRVLAHEFRRLPLRQTRLAVLSVCDSGTYRFGPGNELHGIVAALLTAGVRDVVATLWPIDDAIGSRFVTRFYNYLLDDGPAEALRKARSDLISQGAAIRDWSAFVVVGPGRGP